MTAEALIDALRDPRCYPHAPPSVEVIQTHLSVVCLAGDLVFKLKKAITLPFVDFAPLAARRKACRDEVRLNRRLCKHTYLGTASLRRIDGSPRFATTGDDEGPDHKGNDDLDVAVVMQRLPQDRMLDELVRAGTATEAELRNLAELIVDFHATAERGPDVTAYGDPHKLAGFAAANFTELAVIPDHGLPSKLLTNLAEASAKDFARILPELDQRAKDGLVVDGHGDLHARNVCMTDPPTVYDCIEFEPAFRCGDVATEIAFMAMDLRYLGAPELAKAFVDSYVAKSGDLRLPILLPTLCTYRAMVRAKVAALAAAESEQSAADREGARGSAHRHLLLASAYAIEARGPWWIVVCGPPASGKSRLCRQLADALHWPHLATDVVRKQLAGIASTETARADHYTAEFSERTYAELYRLAAERTRDGAYAVLLDGNFPTPQHRQAVAAAAAEAGARLAVVLIDIDAETAQQRAEARRSEAGNVSDAGAEIAAHLHASFVRPAPTETAVLLRLDGTRPTERLEHDVVSQLLLASS